MKKDRGWVCRILTLQLCICCCGCIPSSPGPGGPQARDVSNQEIYVKFRDAQRSLFRRQPAYLPSVPSLSSVGRTVRKATTKSNSAFMYVLGRAVIDYETFLLSRAPHDSAVSPEKREKAALAFREWLVGSGKGKEVVVLWNRLTDRPRTDILFVCVDGRLWWSEMSGPHWVGLTWRRLLEGHTVETMGSVMSVVRESRRVSFRGGRDIGVARGLRLGVERNGQQVAEVVVDEVSADWSFATAVGTGPLPVRGDVVSLEMKPTE